MCFDIRHQRARSLFWIFKLRSVELGLFKCFNLFEFIFYLYTELVGTMITKVYMSDICLPVKAAIRKRCYLAGLTLALTALYIYGVIEYDSMFGQGSTGKRYIKWFDSCVQDYKGLRHPVKPFGPGFRR